MKVFEIICEACPNHQNAWVLFGRTSFSNRDFVKSCYAYKQAINCNNNAANDSKVLYDYAVSLFRI